MVGDLEQSVGGIETLFKDSASTVIANAEKAYLTAGVNANDYMQQVTSFSASLLQSLGGDTEKAAKAADMAVIDMADNANKMGTAIESIQYAYQGFAKGNYGMLDNLKLGYGGTKKEMERLLVEAEKISGIKYDMSNLNDVYSAIHVIQNELGITGTTAKEGMETLSGSIATAKAALSNFLSGAGGVDSLVGAVSNAATVISANLQELLPRLTTGLTEVISALIPQIPALLNELLPAIIDGATALMDGLISAMPEIIKALTNVLPTVATAILKMVPQLLDTGVEVLLAVVMGITQSLPELIPAAVDAVLTIVDTLIDNIDLLVDAAIAITVAIAEGLINSLPILIEKAPVIIEKLVIALIENGPKLLRAAGEVILQLAKGLIDKLPEMAKMGGRIVTEIIAGIANLYTALMQAGTEVVEKIKTAIINTDWKKLGSDVISGMVEGIKAGAGKVWDAIKSVAQGTIDTARETFDQHSPSRVFEDIYKNNMLGAVQGVEKNKKKVTKSVEQMAKDSFSAAKLWIDDYRNSSDYLASEEIKMWETLSQKYTSVSKEKLEIDKSIKKLQTQALKEQQIAEQNAFAADKARMEVRKFFGIASIQEEIDFWTEMSGKYAEGSKLREEADKSLFESQKRLFDEQETITGKMADAEEKYQQAVDNRAQAIFNSFGLFDELKKKEEVSSQTLVKNLSTQVAEMQKWTDNIQRLSDKGINEGLLADLQAMGPSANAEITALTRMSETELTKYSNLYGEKQAIARAQAEKELVGMREDTNLQIKGLADDLNKIANTSFVFAGENTAQGFIDGIRAKFAELETTMTEMAQIASGTIKSELEISSPSKLSKRQGGFFGQGFIDGVKGMSNAISNTVASVFGGLGSNVGVDGTFTANGASNSSLNGLANASSVASSNGNTFIIKVDMDEVSDVMKLVAIFTDLMKKKTIYGGT